MQGEEHLGNATYKIIQALFIVNSDYYQTNWHSYNAAVYQLGPFFSCKLAYLMLYTI